MLFDAAIEPSSEAIAGAGITLRRLGRTVPMPTAYIRLPSAK